MKNYPLGSLSIVNALAKDLDFTTDSLEVKAIQESVRDASDYDAFFVRVGNGDYTEIWGMAGTVPYLSNLVKRLV